MHHILAILSFYAKYPGWHGYDRRCRQTVRAIRSLERRGYLEVIPRSHTARHTGKVFA